MEGLTILNILAFILILVIALIVFISHRGEIQVSFKKISITWEK